MKKIVFWALIVPLIILGSSCITYPILFIIWIIIISLPFCLLTEVGSNKISNFFVSSCSDMPEPSIFSFILIIVLFLFITIWIIKIIKKNVLK